jgi:hypothetical protein
MLPPRITTIGGCSAGKFSEHGFDHQGAQTTTLSVNEMTAMMGDGGAVISVTVADVVLRKVVYADGRFHVQIEEARDRIAFAGSPGRASLTYGADSVSVVPAADPPTIQRARSLLAGAKVVSTFRRLAERLRRTKRTSASAVSVRLTWALIAEVAGEAGVMTQLTSMPAARVSDSQAFADFRDNFETLWNEHAVGLLSAVPLKPDWRSEELQLRSLDAAFHILLMLESAWYAIATTTNGRHSRAVR